jgi:PilZ domain-containing protein
MYEHGANKHVTGKRTPKTGSATEAERRGADRHIFTASAEVVELGSGARFSTRTTDLGPGGCFVDTMVPFPVGSKVHVNVRKGDSQFETGGLVVYSQSGLGMGIAFDTMEPQQREALDTWLAELTGTRQAAQHIPAAPAKTAATAGRMHGGNQSQSAALVRLVQLMIGKGLLTEAEGSSVLYDPVL